MPSWDTGLASDEGRNCVTDSMTSSRHTYLLRASKDKSITSEQGRMEMKALRNLLAIVGLVALVGAGYLY
jgi:hypothetical protein